jgi:hypothetical protein
MARREPRQHEHHHNRQLEGEGTQKSELFKHPWRLRGDHRQQGIEKQGEFRFDDGCDDDRSLSGLQRDEPHLVRYISWGRSLSVT